MYSKHESSLLRQEFWKAFGQYMSPIASSEGEKINWVNYKTGEKHIFIRTKVIDKRAEVAIEIAHPDPLIRQIYYEHFLKLKQIFEETVGEEWQWALHAEEEGRIVSKIFVYIEGVSIFRKEDWPALISFFKSKMIAVDEFWNLVKHTLAQVR